MKRIFTLVCLVSLALAGYSQARLVFEGNIGIAFDGGTAGTPVYLVIDNPNTNAITDAGAVGGPAIRSESEYHIVKWNVRNSTGTYNVPFVGNTGGIPQYVAASMTVAVPGLETTLGSGSIEFSTFFHDNTLVNTPSDVTHMNQHPSGLPGNEVNTIDRFWVVDAVGYNTKPTVAMGFTYDEDEFDGSMAEPALLVQRFNPTTNEWFDLNLTGNVLVDPVLNSIVTTVPVAGPDFFRSWTISDSNNPLPIQLAKFDAFCLGEDRVRLDWITASEVNNDFFTLERSEDGIFWEAFHYESGAGFSSNELSYSVIDENPFSGITYYRLSQTDFDGGYEIFEPIVSDCDGVGFEIVNAYDIIGTDAMQLTVSAGADEPFDIELLDLNGRRVAFQPNVPFQAGLNYFQIDTHHLPYGIYVVSVRNNQRLMTTKVQLQ